MRAHTECPVPSCVTRLMATGRYHDSSEHGDVCASVERHDGPVGLRVWLDYPSPARRELGGPRFKVHGIVAAYHDAEWGWGDWQFDPTRPYWGTDDEAVLALFLRTGRVPDGAVFPPWPTH